ncbi:MAG: hypothetical protein KBG15_05025 [Kofleriaceae bacterium]|nr:hypothetical protein [Kofleriaceae bacterium]
MEATFALQDDLPAGPWQLVADGIITQPVTVLFELLLRRGSDDTVIGSWQQAFAPRPMGFDAYAVDLEITAPQFAVQPGDLLVFRYSGEMGMAMSYIPNGEGARANGRIPFITLPR